MTVGILGGGQLGRMLALAGYPLGHRVAPRSIPPPMRRAAQVAPAARGRLRRPRRPCDAPRGGCDVRHLRVRERPRRRGPRARRAVAGASARRGARGRRRTGCARSACSSARHPDRTASPRSTRRASCRRRSTHRHARVLKTRRLGYDGKGRPSSARRCRRAEDAWRALGEVPLAPRGVRRRSTASCRSSACARPRRRDAPSIRWSRTTIATASCASRARRRRTSTPGCRQLAERLRRARVLERLWLRGRAGDRAVPGGRPAARQRDGAARAQLRALDDRGRRDQPVREPPARRRRAAARLGRARVAVRRW